MNTQHKTQQSVAMSGRRRWRGLARVLAVLVVTTGLMSSAEIIAKWDFSAAGNFLLDSSGNGHQLISNNGAGWSNAAPPGSGLTGSVAFTKGGIFTMNTLNLTPYRKLRISWWQLVQNTTAAVVFEQWINGGGQLGLVTVIVNAKVGASDIAGTGSAWLNATMPNVDFFPHLQGTANTTWEKFTVEYDLDAAGASEVVKVFNGAGVNIGTASGMQGAAPASFLNFQLYLGARNQTELPLVGNLAGITIETIPAGK